MDSLLVLLQAPAGGAAGGGAAGGAPPGGLDSLTVMLPLFLILYGVAYFMLIRPQQKKQQAERQELLDSIKKNDEVLTSSGIIGKVANIDEGKGQVTLKVDESNNVRIRVLRSSIAEIMNRQDKNKDKTNKDKTKETAKT